LAAEEEIVTAYKFGVYDLLVLPPSFPYGGMVCVFFYGIGKETLTLIFKGKCLPVILDSQLVHDHIQRFSDLISVIFQLC